MEEGKQASSATALVCVNKHAYLTVCTPSTCQCHELQVGVSNCDLVALATVVLEVLPSLECALYMQAVQCWVTQQLLCTMSTFTPNSGSSTPMALLQAL